MIWCIGALCIGVTTSLSHGEIRAQSPDAVYKQIGSISIENLFSLQKQSTGILHSKQGDQNKALLTQVSLMTESLDLVYENVKGLW